MCMQNALNAISVTMDKVQNVRDQVDVDCITCICTELLLRCANTDTCGVHAHR